MLVSVEQRNPVLSLVESLFCASFSFYGYVCVYVSVSLPLVWPGEIPWSWSHGGCEPSNVGARN